MSEQTDKNREDWVRGRRPDASGDEFARRAARGREELAGPEEARDLLAELDGMIGERFADPTANATDAAAAAGAKQETNSGGTATLRRLPRLYAVAAALLLLVALGWWWSQRQPTFDPEAVYAAAFEPYANDLTDRRMGDDDPATDPAGRTLAAASLNYDRGDYAGAADSFARVLNLEPAPAPPVVRLYYGISLLAADRAQTAAPILEALRNDPEYGNPATWYLALAWLRQGQISDARTTLNAIPADSPFRSRADRLLEQLR